LVVKNNKEKTTGNVKMEEKLLKIIERYKNQFVVKHEKRKVCTSCDIEQQFKEFFVARNPLMPTTRISVCRTCLDKHINFDDYMEAQYFLSLCHAPFVEDVWEVALTKDKPIGYYFKTINLTQYSKLDPQAVHRIRKAARQYDADPYQAKMDMLTPHEAGYLKAKWGESYDMVDRIKLEEYYDEMMEDYEIITRSHKDYLKMIIKTSLAMEKALDEADYDNYKKLAKAYDDLMKSADFVQSKKQEKKDENAYNAFGVVFEMAEKKGFIPQYHKEPEKDIVDKTIKNLKNWTLQLVRGEADLEQLLENAAKRVVEQEKEEEKQEGNEQYPAEIEGLESADYDKDFNTS